MGALCHMVHTLSAGHGSIEDVVLRIDMRDGRWMMTVEADFGIDILFVMLCYMSTCGYIVMQLFKLSPVES
ncbi:hypothetical protein Tco_0134185 [Tanacetum coccineum]